MPNQRGKKEGKCREGVKLFKIKRKEREWKKKNPMG